MRRSTQNHPGSQSRPATRRSLSFLFLATRNSGQGALRRVSCFRQTRKHAWLPPRSPFGRAVCLIGRVLILPFNAEFVISWLKPPQAEAHRLFHKDCCCCTSREVQPSTTLFPLLLLRVQIDISTGVRLPLLLLSFASTPFVYPFHLPHRKHWIFYLRILARSRHWKTFASLLNSHRQTQKKNSTPLFPLCSIHSPYLHWRNTVLALPTLSSSVYNVRPRSTIHLLE